MTAQLTVTDLHKSYGTNEVLRGVSLSANAGDVISVIGSSGSGKSTCLRCINFLERPHKASITLEGETLSLQTAKDGMLQAKDNKQLQRFRAKLAMVFQHFNLFPHLTIVDNLTLAPIWVHNETKQEAREKALKLLDRVGIKDQAEKYPNQLSGGQQQRVAIARSLCTNPKIMLFDEPTSALDPEMISEVLDVMIELAREGITMICVTHEMGFARKVANRIIFMDDGQIVEENDPENFFNNAESDRLQLFLNQILTH